MNIYKFYSANAFIRKCFEQKKKSNSSFSIRAWAKSMGLKSHTSLHGIINSQKNTPISMHGHLSRSLRLSDQESHYLRLLINIENSRDQYSRAILLDKVETIQKNINFSMHQLAEFEILSDPLWGAIIEMTDRLDFVNDPSWISGI